MSVWRQRYWILGFVNCNMQIETSPSCWNSNDLELDITKLCVCDSHIQHIGLWQGVHSRDILVSTLSECEVSSQRTLAADWLIVWLVISFMHYLESTLSLQTNFRTKAKNRRKCLKSFGNSCDRLYYLVNKYENRILILGLYQVPFTGNKNRTKLDNRIETQNSSDMTFI